MNIKIEGTNTLERIATALERIATLLEKPSSETPAQIPESVKPTPAKVEAPKPVLIETSEQAELMAIAEEPVVEQPKEVNPTITLDEIRKKVVQLSAAGDQAKDAVRQIITEYARKVSDIPQEMYGEVMERLNAVKKEA